MNLQRGVQLALCAWFGCGVEEWYGFDRRRHDYRFRLRVGRILICSIVRPENRVWPPPGQQTWQYVLVWLLTILAFAGFVVVGVLDWNSLGWPVMFRWPIGSVLIVGVNVLAWVGVRQLSLKTTSGSKGPLVTDGLYQYSRNPQYTGDIAIIGGWAILFASVWAIPLCLGGMLAFVLTPFAEESWREDLHGDTYLEYCRRVSRFFGRSR